MKENMSTQEVVEKYFEYANNGDWESWLDLFADNIVLIEPIGTIEGIATLRSGIEGIKKGYKRFQNHLLELFINGNRAAALTRIEAITASGISIDLKAVNTYTIENDRIVYQENIFDSIKIKPFLEQNIDQAQ